ncbi:MAG: TonB-dependent receptor [Bryobacterales bacterium]|nr:TonB-dependent receptor [Bryobacterales bacterium]
MRLFVFAILGLAASLHAQQAGRITGTVTDPSGAAIGDAAVVATNVQTGESRRSTTNVTGTYVIAPLGVGDYSLEARKEGFKTASRSGLRIDVSASPVLDLQLEVGSLSDRIDVSAQAIALNTESQAIGNSRYEAQLRNLPIIVREVQALVGQTAGVPYGTTDTVGGNFAQGGRSSMQVLSDGAQLNPFQTTAWPAIDGIGRRADLTLPGVDAIAEVKWVTNGGSAEFAQPTQVIVASKSGANVTHGSLFEFYRSGGLGARRWEAANRESFVRHQLGGTVGGRIKKDKMFFFGGFEVFRHTSGQLLNARHPTGAERSGDLSNLLRRVDARGAAAPVNLNDPLSGAVFPGNIIPANRISPVSTELLKLIPAAPVPAGRLTDFNTVVLKPLFDKSEKYDVRYDYEINPNNRLFARATIARLDQASRFSGSVPGTYGYTTKKEWTQAVSSNWTHIVNPSTVTTAQFSFRSMPFKNIPSGGDTVFPVKINDVAPAPPFGGGPAVLINSNGNGISDLFDRLLFNYSADYGYTFDPTITKTIGNHTVKAGFTFLRGYKTQELASPPYGRFQTSSDFNNARSTTSATGDAYGDFLLGYPSNTDVTVGPAGAFVSKTNFAGFAQDDWKITSRLTINLGLRWDHFGFFEEMNGRAAVGNFRTGKIAIQEGSQSLILPVFQSFSDRYIFNQQLGLPGTFVKSNNRDFAPRLGVAYRSGRGFVLRGGFGIYAADVTHNEFTDMYNQAPFVRRAQLTRSLLTSQGVNVNSIYTFQNPSANASAAGADTSLTTVGGFPENYPTQKAYTWSLTVEKDLGHAMVLRSSYLANVTRNMSRSVRVNACVPGPTECLSRAVTDPAGRKWPFFANTLGRHIADGRSNYQSGEIEFSKRFTQGLLFDVNYAHSRLLGLAAEATNPVAAPKWSYDYGPISAQPNDIFHWNFVYELPVGKGRRLGSGMHAAADAIVGGWMLSGLGTWQSGVPLTITANTGQSPTGAATNRADRLKDGALSHDGSRGEAAFQWFDTTAYAIPALINPSAPRPTRQFGTGGIGTIIGPSFFTYDMTLHKVFRIHERFNLQFRAEAYNPFNVPMLANPDTDVLSANFGRIRASNTAYTSRNLQFGVRLDF